MPQRIVTVAPSRLHFGLYGFGKNASRQFGGVGAMVQSPSLRVALTPSDRFSAVGPLAERVAKFAERWTAFHRLDRLPHCRIEVLQAPAEHTGLGVGTQLGLSVAASLNAWTARPSATPVELALSVGRGLRSAVGTYGFMYGGLIAERGKQAEEILAPLDVRVGLPSTWRFVLVTPQADSGISGVAESHAFERLPPVPETTTERLIRLAREELVPSAVQADYVRFSAALGRYCYEAGLCFAAVQGGAYNGPRLTALVEQMRRCGVEGIGQSSWGPTLFALLPDENAAGGFVDRLRSAANDIAFRTEITPPNNSGAEVSIHPADDDRFAQR